MPSAVLPTLSDDEIDDLLYLARIDDLDSLKAGIHTIALAQNASPEDILTATIQPISGNSLMHMAAANGCINTLEYLLSDSSSTSGPPFLNLNLQNDSGNTPLHWAALNGHLDAVKLLVGAGADPAVRNRAGHDAVYEAERSGKEEVVKWLLSEGKGLETGVTGRTGDGEEDVYEEETKRKESQNEDGTGANAIRDVKNGVEHVESEDMG